MLASLAAGEASAEELLDIRPHLRNCPGCRATVRALHASRLRRVTALLPLGAVVEPVRGLFERLRGRAARPSVGELHPMQRAEQLDEAFRQLHPVEPGGGRGREPRLDREAEPARLGRGGRCSGSRARTWRSASTRRRAAAEAESPRSPR